jgi:TolB protein
MGAWDEEAQRRKRAVRNRRAGAVSIAACIVVAVIVGVVMTRDDRNDATPSVGAEPTGAEVTIVNVASGKATAFGVPAGASEFDVTLDGSRVAYSNLDADGTRQVFVMDVDGANVRQLTHGADDASNPEWSTDASMIAHEGKPGAISEIFVVRVADGESTRVTQEPNDAWDPTWAPDDRSILFSTPDASGHVLLAKSIDLASGQTRTIVTDASLPALSPDGTRIAFDSYAMEPLIRLSLANADGSHRRVIARSSEDGFVKWSPNSAQIAFIGRTDDDGLGTYVFDLRSGETAFVTAGSIEGWFDDSSILVVASA